MFYVNIKITEKRGKITRHQGAHVKPRKHDKLKKPVQQPSPKKRDRQQWRAQQPSPKKHGVLKTWPTR
jgi:hypothetical protein